MCYHVKFGSAATKGIRGTVLQWLKQFFTGRTHQTKIETILSDLAVLLSGVVQGIVGSAHLCSWFT